MTSVLVGGALSYVSLEGPTDLWYASAHKHTQEMSFVSFMHSNLARESSRLYNPEFKQLLVKSQLKCLP